MASVFRDGASGSWGPLGESVLCATADLLWEVQVSVSSNDESSQNRAGSRGSWVTPSSCPQNRVSLLDRHWFGVKDIYSKLSPEGLSSTEYCRRLQGKRPNIYPLLNSRLLRYICNWRNWKVQSQLPFWSNEVSDTLKFRCRPVKSIQLYGPCLYVDLKPDDLYTLAQYTCMIWSYNVSVDRIIFSLVLRNNFLHPLEAIK